MGQVLHGSAARQRQSPGLRRGRVCIVHLLRNPMSFVSWKGCKPIAQALRSVYRAETAEAGRAALDAFEASPWCKHHPAIAQRWRRHWDHVIPFFAFPEGVHRIIYTTNAIEALNSKLRRAVRTRGHFPGADAAMKLLYFVRNTAAQEWKRPYREWSEAKTQFAIIVGERFVIRCRSWPTARSSKAAWWPIPACPNGLERDATPAQLAIAWLLTRDGILPIPKAGSVAHVRDNRAALDLTLSEAELRCFDDLFPPPRGPEPLAML